VSKLLAIEKADVASRVVSFVALLSITILVGIFVFLILGTTRFHDVQGGVDNHTMDTCVDRFKGMLGSDLPTITDLYGINSFCYDHTASQLLVDEEIIKRDNYVFQRNENVVLLYMVVLITFGGVLLAGLQLYASYKLATTGHGDLAGGTEFTYSPQGASFRSSVVGLSILALSFAFFLVFVLYVYRFTDNSASQRQNATVQPQSAPAATLPTPQTGAPQNSTTPN
jgi:hypothetical protein